MPGVWRHAASQRLCKPACANHEAARLAQSGLDIVLAGNIWNARLGCMPAKAVGDIDGLGHAEALDSSSTSDATEFRDGWNDEALVMRNGIEFRHDIALETRIHLLENGGVGIERRQRLAHRGIR